MAYLRFVKTAFSLSPGREQFLRSLFQEMTEAEAESGRLTAPADKVETMAGWVDKIMDRVKEVGQKLEQIRVQQE